MAALTELPDLPAEIQFSAPIPPYFYDLHAQLEPVWRHRPAMLTFHFGVPPPDIVQRAKDLGIALGMTATSVAEANAIERAGADFIIAQGAEAGGHRGTFDPAGHGDQWLSTDDLLTDLLRDMRARGASVPIVAAGGIMDGADAAHFIRHGAAAVQMGTAFITALESTASSAHRACLLDHNSHTTQFTRAYTGRSAQGILNDFMRLMEYKPLLPFPVQAALTSPLRIWATMHGDPRYQAMYSGTGFNRCKAVPAAEIVADIEKALLQAVPTTPSEPVRLHTAAEQRSA